MGFSQRVWTSIPAKALSRRDCEFVDISRHLTKILRHEADGAARWDHVRRLFIICSRLQRLGGHVQVQRILRTRHEYPGVLIAAHETRVREGLMTLPGESWSWQRHAKEHFFHHCGHFRTLRRVIVMVAGALDEGGFVRHAMLCLIYRKLEIGAKDNGHDVVCGVGRCSDCPTPTPDPTSSGHPPKLQQWSLGTGKQPQWSQQRNS